MLDLSITGTFVKSRPKRLRRLPYLLALDMFSWKNMDYGRLRKLRVDLQFTRHHGISSIEDGAVTVDSSEGR